MMMEPDVQLRQSAFVATVCKGDAGVVARRTGSEAVPSRGRSHGRLHSRRQRAQNFRQRKVCAMCSEWHRFIVLVREEVRDAALVSEWNVIGYSARIYKQWFCPAYAEAAATGSAIDSLCPARLLLVCRSFDPAFYSWFFTGMLQYHYRPNPPRADRGEGAALKPSGATR